MRLPNRRGKGQPQPWFLDLLAEAIQDRVRVLSLPADGRAELRAGPPEEVERVPAVTLVAGTIELRCERHKIEPVGLIHRHGKAQQRQLPGAEQPVRFFD